MSTFLGIDLGTSSVKFLLRNADGSCRYAKQSYAEKSLSGWWDAVCRGLKAMQPAHLDGIGLSAQVGTYIVNGGERIIGWDGAAGIAELRKIKEDITQDTFLSEISMPHPDLLSYPMPAILAAGKQEKPLHSICMPKDFLVEKLTGNRVSDPWSWRGLANLEKGKFSEKMLDYLELDASLLPTLLPSWQEAGKITHQAAKETGIAQGTPVYIGCNDFFAGLLGSGVQKPGDLFDITGTSEHAGGVATENTLTPNIVSGKYFFHCVRYGVTASSGPSLDFMRRNFGEHIDPEEIKRKKPPIFLPYLQGERCPVCDPDARGVFFGIDGKCGKEEMAYAVMEGVCFSLRHILEKLEIKKGRMIVSGGAAENTLLNQMKADILGVEMAVAGEKEASALGACMMAMTGSGACADLAEAQKICCREEKTFFPVQTDYYEERFQLYKRLYPVLKNEFQALGRMKKI